MMRTALEGLRGSFQSSDNLGTEAAGNAMVVSRVLSRFVCVLIDNLLQVRAVGHAKMKTGKIDAGVLASLRAAGYLTATPNVQAEMERRRPVPCRYQVARHLLTEETGHPRAALVPAKRRTMEPQAGKPCVR